MATRQQRSRKHARRVHHQLAQRARLRAALDAARRSGKLTETMQQHGYEVDWKRPDRWRRIGATHQPVHPKAPRRGPSWGGIMAKRKRKASRSYAQTQDRS